MAKMGLVSRVVKRGDRSRQLLGTKKGQAPVGSLTYVSVNMTFSSLRSRDKEGLERILLRLDRHAGSLLGGAPKEKLRDSVAK
jgi:hypothetical protein